jgi:gas vesicle protein
LKTTETIIMNLDPQTEFNQQDENTSNVPTGQFYIRAVGTTPSTELPKKENVSNTSTLPRENSSDSKPQSNQQKGNNNLNKVLLGGLLGATLGTLAAALANKKTAQGANLAAKGVGDAVKSVGEGVNVAARGVGDAAKTVAEGVNQGLVSPVVDAIKDTTEGAKKTLGSTVDQLKQTAEYVNPADREFAPQTTYVLIPVEKERIIERTIIVEPTLPTESGEDNFMPEEPNQQAQDSYQTNQFNEQNADYHE